MAAVSRARTRGAPRGGAPLRRGAAAPRPLRASRSEDERAGTMAFDVANRRSRIAYLHAIMLDPDYRGARPGDGGDPAARPPPRLRPRLPPGAARGVRIQRARPPSLRARRLPARGRAPAGVLAARRVGRRDPLRARPRGSRARSLAAGLLALFGHRSGTVRAPRLRFSAVRSKAGGGTGCPCRVKASGEGLRPQWKGTGTVGSPHAGRGRGQRMDARRRERPDAPPRRWPRLRLRRLQPLRRGLRVRARSALVRAPRLDADGLRSGSPAGRVGVLLRARADGARPR